MHIGEIFLVYVVPAFLLLLMWRNNLTLNCRLRAIYYIYEHGLTYKLFEQTSYDAMMWDFTKWSFEAFYPDYVERDEHEQLGI